MGLRFTLTRDNAHMLPEMLDLCDAEGVDKFYLSHLVYAGRGDKHRGEDAAHRHTRVALDHLIDRAWVAVAEDQPLEIADSHITVLDGDTFGVLARFETPFAVHGGPKFSPDGRLVYVVSRDGWVQKYDLWGLTEMGRIRAGLNARNIALSADGKWLAVANYLPMTLAILDAATLKPEKVIEIRGRDGMPSRVSAVMGRRGMRNSSEERWPTPP